MLPNGVSVSDCTDGDGALTSTVNGIARRSPAASLSAASRAVSASGPSPVSGDERQHHRHIYEVCRPL